MTRLDQLRSSVLGGRIQKRLEIFKRKKIAYFLNFKSISSTCHKNFRSNLKSRQTSSLIELRKSQQRLNIAKTRRQLRRFMIEQQFFETTQCGCYEKCVFAGTSIFKHVSMTTGERKKKAFSNFTLIFTVPKKPKQRKEKRKEKLRQAHKS